MFCDAESYYFRLSHARNAFWCKISAFTRSIPTNNNDGIHLGGNCEDGIIRHLRGLGRGAPNDDMVAMNADDVLQRVECYGQECGPIRNVRVYDLHADDCHTFVRLLSVDSPIEHIDIEGVRGGCQIAMLNMDGARGCRVPMFDDNDPRYANGVGCVRDVRIRDVQVCKSGTVASPLINLQQRADGLRIEGFQRLIAQDAAPAAPTILAGHLPDQHLVIEGVAAAQGEALRAASSAASAIHPLPDGEIAVQAHVTSGTELRLPVGGFRRFTVHAGSDGCPQG